MPPEVDVTEIRRAAAWLTPARRARIYQVATVVIPLAVAYGLVTGEQAAVWLASIAGLLAVPVAAAHTPIRKD